MYISGESLRTSSSDPLAIGTTTYSAILAFLLGQRPPKPLNAERSAEVGLGHQYQKRVPSKCDSPYANKLLSNAD